MLNLNKCPFLAAALEFIRENPGCSKRDVVLMNGHVPNQTYAGRNSRLNKLISAGLVVNRGTGNGYKLYVVE